MRSLRLHPCLHNTETIEHWLVKRIFLMTNGSSAEIEWCGDMVRQIHFEEINSNSETLNFSIAQLIRHHLIRQFIVQCARTCAYSELFLDIQHVHGFAKSAAMVLNLSHASWIDAAAVAASVSSFLCAGYVSTVPPHSLHCSPISFTSASMVCFAYSKVCGNFERSNFWISAKLLSWHVVTSLVQKLESSVLMLGAPRMFLICGA